MRYECPGISRRVGVKTEDRLAGEVCCDVGDEPVLPYGNDDVIGSEEESSEVASLDVATPPVGGDARGNGRRGGAGCRHGFVGDTSSARAAARRA